MERLAQILKRIGKPGRQLQNPDGSWVLILPYGGRVLGLFAPNDCENFYWTHPALNSVATACEFYRGSQWHNSGGGRTWLSPEADFFFPNFPKLDKYVQQRSLDPGNYRVVENRGGFRLVNVLRLRSSRNGNTLRLRIEKRFGPAPNPLRYEKEPLTDGVKYAGYTQYTSLAAVPEGQTIKEQIGLWDLIQFPHPGEVLIPTFSRTMPKQIFNSVGSIPSRDLVAAEHLTTYRMRQKGEHKISVRAVSVCGRIGYLHRNGENWALIVRNFFVNPSGEYVDVPWSETNYLGFAVQACNVNSALGAFNEVEYHVPAIGTGTGRLRCEDVSQVWAFRGPRDSIRHIRRRLLS